jgi:hypothetical protein
MQSHRCEHTVAGIPEKLTPVEAAQHIYQFRVPNLYDRTAFIDKGEQIPEASAAAAFARYCAYVKLIQPGLGSRKGKPRKCIEEIVPVSSARLYAAGLEYAIFVVAVLALGSAWGNEADRLSARHVETSGFGERIEALDAGTTRAYVIEPVPIWGEDRVL